jgi:50S ribosomal subunit-associated GTPase HflX
VFTKIDLVPEDEREKRIKRLAKDIGLAVAPGRGEQPVVISAATGEGVRDLLERAYAMVKGEAMPTEWRR